MLVYLTNGQYHLQLDQRHKESFEVVPLYHYSLILKEKRGKSMLKSSFGMILASLDTFFSEVLSDIQIKTKKT